MNKQEIFNKVYYHLIAQGKPSYNSFEGVCAYRGVNGTSCAIGCLFPDELYDDSIEGDSVLSKSIQEILEKVGIKTDRKTIGLLFDLQTAHDNVLGCGIETFKGRMRRIAKFYDLEFPEG